VIFNQYAKPIVNALTLGAALGVWLLPAAPTVASNHIDSPLTTQDRGANIADHYAFLDPNDNSKIVLIMSTQGFIVSSEHFGMGIFDSNQRYRWEFASGDDASPSKYIDVYYSPGLGHLTAQTATILLPGGHRFTAPTTVAVQTPHPNPPIITTDSATGARFFAGVMDDPFFLDDTGANLFVASSVMHPGHPDKSLLGRREGRNTYAGFNTLITAIELPVSMLKGGSDVIAIDTVTQRQRNQTLRQDGEIFGSGDIQTVDREGVPFVNNVLIPPPLKNQFGTSNTVEDARGKFRPAITEGDEVGTPPGSAFSLGIEVGDLAGLKAKLEKAGIASLKALATDNAHIAKILDLVQLHGDFLRLNVKVPNAGPGGGTNVGGGFLHDGGRRLQDDVSTETFTLINNGVRLTDDVLHDEQPFRSIFPFVADPNQPYPPGHERSNMMQ